MSNYRAGRLAEELKKSLSEIIARMKDPRVPMVSIIRAEVARDLKNANVYISVLGDENSQTEAIKVITKAAGFIRREFARESRLRQVPELNFILDDSISYSIKISKMLKNEQGQRDEKNEEQ